MQYFSKAIDLLPEGVRCLENHNLQFILRNAFSSSELKSSIELMESHKNLQTSSLRGALQTLRVRFFFWKHLRRIGKTMNKDFLGMRLTRISNFEFGDHYSENTTWYHSVIRLGDTSKPYPIEPSNFYKK